MLARLDRWLDKKLEELRKEEEKVGGFKLPEVQEKKSDWRAFYSQLPISPKDLRNEDSPSRSRGK